MPLLSFGTSSCACVDGAQFGKPKTFFFSKIPQIFTTALPLFLVSVFFFLVHGNRKPLMSLNFTEHNFSRFPLHWIASLWNLFSLTRANQKWEIRFAVKYRAKDRKSIHGTYATIDHRGRAFLVKDFHSTKWKYCFIIDLHDGHLRKAKLVWLSAERGKGV